MSQWSVIRNDGPHQTIEADSIEAGDYGIWFVKDGDIVAFVSASSIAAVIQKDVRVNVSVEVGPNMTDPGQDGWDVAQRIKEREETLTGGIRVS